MAPTDKDVEQKRERLLAARDECLAQLSDRARRALKQGAALSKRPQLQKDGTLAARERTDGHEMAPSSVAPEIRNLIAEARRLRGKAEQGRDIRTAMKGLDTALKALELYGRVTGEIRDHRSATVTVNVMATREEGIQTAAELLLELARPAELVLLIGQLQKRLAELESLRDVAKVALPTAAVEVIEPQLLEAARPQENEEEIG